MNFLLNSFAIDIPTKESTVQREMKIRLNMYVRLFIHSMVCKPNHNELKLARAMERNGNATANGEGKNRCTKFSFHFPKGMPLNLPCFCIPFNTRFENYFKFQQSLTWSFSVQCGMFGAHSQCKRSCLAFRSCTRPMNIKYK